MNNFNMNRESRSNKKFQVPKELPVRHGAVDCGRDYEIRILALLVLRCIRHKDVENMWAGSNVEDCGAFDDVVLHIETTVKKRITYMVQLKHKEDGNDNIKAKEFKKGDFSVVKYYDSVKQIKTRIDSRGDNGSEIINHLRDNQESIVFILYTNRDTTKNDFLIRINKKSDIDDEWLLYTMLNTKTGCVSKFDYKRMKQFTCENDYKRLMEKFFLFTKQTNVDEIDALITNELNGFLGSLSLLKQTAADILGQYLQYVTDWYKGKLGGRYPLTKEHIHKILLANIIAPYKKELQVSSDHFNYDVWNDIMIGKSLTVIEADQLVNDFVLGCIMKATKSYCDENKKLWKHHPDKLSRSVLKIVKRSKEVKPSEAYEYLWKTKEIPLLLNVDTTHELKSLIALIRLFPDTFFIIIISKIPLSSHDVSFRLCNLNSFIVTGLHNLDDQQVQRILKCPIKLQERECVELSQFLTKKDLHYISMKDIVYILNNKLTVGDELPSLSEIFIERTLNAVWLKPEILVESKNEVFLIKCSQDDDLKVSSFLRELKIDNSEISHWSNNSDIEYKTSRIIKIKDHASVKEIEKCSVMKNKNFHYVILHKGKYLQWVKSCGSVKHIRDFRKCSHLSSYELMFKNPMVRAFSNKTTLVTACPGMGKSLLLDYISTNLHLDMWVLKVNLYQYSNDNESDNLKNLNAAECLRHFFTRNITKNQKNDLTKFIFEKLLESKRIMVLFDGFDEVPDSLRGETLKMIKIISESDYYTGITTRPNLKFYLEKELNAIGIGIDPFSTIDQTTYLTQFFLRKCGEEHLPAISEYVEQLLALSKRNLSDQDDEFTGIPLQTMLLAEAFTKECKGFIEQRHFKCEHFDLVYLYKNFIDGKIRIVCKKFGSNSRDTFLRYKKYRSMYALKLLFTTEDLKDLNIEEQLNQVMEFIPDFLNDIQKDGIIFVQNETNVVFVHRTFAEYLAAEWLASNINYPNQNSIKKIFKKIFHPSFTAVRNIFDRILAEDCPLHLAIINRQVVTTRRLLSSNPNHLLNVDRGSRTIIHLIASWGVQHPFDFEFSEIESIRKMIFKDPMKEMIQILPDEKITSSQDTLLNFTPLDYALQSGCLHIADAICAKLEMFDGCLTLNDVNLFSYLHVYLREFPYGSLGSVLIKHCITEELTSILKKNPLKDDEIDQLHNAILQGSVKEVSVKLCFQHNINQIDCNGFSYLHKAVILGDAVMTQLLVTNNADVNLKDATGKTSVHWASIESKLNIMTLLLSSNANVNAVDNYSMSALHYAIVANVVNRDQIVSTLLRNGADISLKDNYNKTVLHYALHYNEIGIFKLLFKFGANLIGNIDYFKNDQLSEILSIKDADGGTVLHWATDKGLSDIVSLLLSYGAYVGITDDDGNTPLHWAAQNNFNKTPLIAAAGKGNDDVLERNSLTPIGSARSVGYCDTVKTLLLHGANTEALNNAMKTPLMIAVENGNNNVVEIILSNGANIQAKDVNSWTCLHVAGFVGHCDTVETLLLHSANTEALDNCNRTPLHLAVKAGNHNVVEMLLSHGADVQAKDIEGCTSLHVASTEGHYDTVKVILLHSTNTEALSNYNRTPLHLAAEAGNTNIVEILLSNGADVQAEDTDSWTSLHVASMAGYSDTVKVLLRYSANVDALDHNNRTPLFCAAQEGNDDIVEILLLNGADVQTKDKNSLTCLHVASTKGHYDTVKTLLLHSANIEALDYYNRTPLFIAAQEGNNDVVEILLSNGADVQAKDRNSLSALHVASVKGHYDTVNALFLRSANKEALDTYNRTPLLVTAWAGNNNILEILLSNGAAIEAKDKESCTSLHAACFAGHYDTVKTLILHGANTEALDNYNRTPLHLAAKAGNNNVVEILLLNGADVQAKDKDSLSCLHVASTKGHYDTVKTLLLHSANIEALDNYNRTSLFIAAQEGNNDVVEILLSNGADVQAKDINSLSSLHVASIKGHYDTVKALLLRGANKEALNSYNRTPLLVTARTGNINVLEILLSNGAAIEAKDKEGCTSLHVASAEGHYDTVKTLILHGANTEALDNYNRTPLHLAAKAGNNNVVEILLSNGTDVQAIDRNSRTPLHVASFDGHYAIVKTLLLHGANTEALTNDNRTPLLYAAHEGNNDVVEILLSNQANIQAKDKDSCWTALHVASFQGHGDTVKTLLRHSANIEALGSYNRTPLLVCAQAGNHNVVETLLSNGANVEAKDEDTCWTSLHVATVEGHYNTVKVLLLHSANTEALDNDNKTPLFYAVQKGYGDIVELILSSGANVQAKDKNNWTSLHVASVEGHYVTVKTLLLHGASTEAFDNYNRTPLYLAAQEGHRNVVEILLSNGADVKAMDRNNSTSLHLASFQGHYDTVKALLLYGGKVEALNKYNRTPIMLAFQKGHVDIVEILLLNKATLPMKGEDGKADITRAGENGLTQ